MNDHTDWSDSNDLLRIEFVHYFLNSLAGTRHTQAKTFFSLCETGTTSFVSYLWSRSTWWSKVHISFTDVHLPTLLQLLLSGFSSRALNCLWQVVDRFDTILPLRRITYFCVGRLFGVCFHSSSWFAIGGHHQSTLVVFFIVDQIHVMLLSLLGRVDEGQSPGSAGGMLEEEPMLSSSTSNLVVMIL